MPLVLPLPKPHGVRTCRACGCTDDDCSQCVAKTGHPCSWVEEDLCSACVKPGVKRFLEQREEALDDLDALDKIEDDELEDDGLEDDEPALVVLPKFDPKKRLALIKKRHAVWLEERALAAEKTPARPSPAEVVDIVDVMDRARALARPKSVLEQLDEDEHVEVAEEAPAPIDMSIDLDTDLEEIPEVEEND